MYDDTMQKNDSSQFSLPLSLSTSFEHQCAKRNTLRVPGSLEKFQNPLFNWNPPIFLHSFYTDNIYTYIKKSTFITPLLL